MRALEDVAVPMRDGTVLRADVYLPNDARRVPAVVGRTPYDRSFGPTPPAVLDPERATEAGLALVCQDVRGQHASEGRFYPFRNEAGDGFDTVEWTAAQDWCDGAVGMAGRSYAAATQWLAAAESPPHLKAFTPVVVGSDPYHGWVYQGGAFELGFNLFWVHLMTGGRKRVKLEEQYLHLPISEPPLLDDSPAGPFYRDWLAHPMMDDYWRAIAINRRYGNVRAPALNIGGWYDIFLGGTLENFAGLRTQGGSDAARSHTRLVVGPWAHGSTYGAYPDHDFAEFGPQSRIDLAELQVAFLARHLTGRDGEERAPVRIFVMGENRWRDEDGWPLARARIEAWHLRGDGLLSREPPGEEPADTYEYDPHDPAPTIGGPTSLPGKFMRTNSGPADQRPLGSRGDVLAYTSPVLDAALEVTGPLELVIHAATSAPDTDFVAKLCDVGPDGSARILAEGVLRARYRDCFEEERLLSPGEICEYRIDLVATSNLFLAGHRVQLLVTSSSFPRLDRNANSGNPVGADTAADLRPATQTVFHDRSRPSRLLLPVVQ